MISAGIARVRARFENTEEIFPIVYPANHRGPRYDPRGNLCRECRCCRSLKRLHVE